MPTNRGYSHKSLYIYIDCLENSLKYVSELKKKVRLFWRRDLNVPNNRNRNAAFSNCKFQIATLTASSAEKSQNEIANRCGSKSQLPNRNVFACATLGIRKGGGQNVSCDLGEAKRTIKCPLQTQFWRPQKVGFVWSVPLRRMTLREQKGGGKSHHKWGGPKPFSGRGFMVCCPLP